MANYKVKGNVGAWTDGQVITDADLAANPGLGGVERLRDKLRVIEDTLDEPTGDPRAPEVTTGRMTKTAATTTKAADPFAAKHPAGKTAPNADDAAHAGKS